MRQVTLLIFAWLMVSVNAFCQQPITWQTESVDNLKNSESRSYSCTFKIYPGDRIDWIQGQKVFSFTITSTEGSLPETENGSVTYHLSKEGKGGKVIVERTGRTDIELTLDLRGENPLAAYYRFKVFVP